MYTMAVTRVTFTLFIQVCETFYMAFLTLISSLYWIALVFRHILFLNFCIFVVACFFVLKKKKPPSRPFSFIWLARISFHPVCRSLQAFCLHSYSRLDVFHLPCFSLFYIILWRSRYCKWVDTVCLRMNSESQLNKTLIRIRTC